MRVSYLYCFCRNGGVGKHPLKNCPYIDTATLKSAEIELEQQYKEGKWLKKDMAKEALVLAKHKTASMEFADIVSRIGGKFETVDNTTKITLPYFNKQIIITKESIKSDSGDQLTRNEQTFIYIHMAHGGKADPTGNMKSFKEFPNTVSKVVSMNERVETPLKNRFSSNIEKLELSCKQSGGKNVKALYDSPDLAYVFTVFPKVAVTLLFWDSAVNCSLISAKSLIQKK